MFLESLATALPPHRFTQADCLAALEGGGATAALAPRSHALLRRILTGGRSGIEARHFCLDDPTALLARDAQALNESFEREAPRLAADALGAALAKSGLAAEELDALFVCTCTGYLCPGISSHLAEGLGAREDAYLHDLVGLGCGAAIPLLRTAAGFLAAHPGARVATVAVEVSSAAFFLDDDPGVLVSLCLFGDGAAAAVWSDRAEAGKWRVGGFSTLHRPAEREKIRFVNERGRLKNQLHKEVPELAARAVGELYARRRLEPDRVLAHAGGRDVVEAVEAILPHRLEDTRAVLRDCGNLSSPSVLFAVERALAAPGEDRAWWVASFGAGFSAHACEWTREPG
jgi:predicted naringenin-chalcone synthase